MACRGVTVELRKGKASTLDQIGKGWTPRRENNIKGFKMFDFFHKRKSQRGKYEFMLL